jgi:hypothetical protein
MKKNTKRTVSKSTVALPSIAKARKLLTAVMCDDVTLIEVRYVIEEDEIYLLAHTRHESGAESVCSLHYDGENVRYNDALGPQKRFPRGAKPLA